jgi:hypothetical protein
VLYTSKTFGDNILRNGVKLYPTLKNIVNIFLRSVKTRNMEIYFEMKGKYSYQSIYSSIYVKVSILNNKIHVK